MWKVFYVESILCGKYFMWKVFYVESILCGKYFMWKVFYRLTSIFSNSKSQVTNKSSSMLI